tara:strand:- start:2952 stop:3956 length:1005 start_codon:yes stop_codon:yes gene_type:complete
MKNPYIIAEIGINHNGRIKDIKKLIYSAKKSGANAVKFQLFKAETLASKNSKLKSLYKKKKKETLYQMWKRLEISNSKLSLIKKITSKLKIDLIFSVFDNYSINRIKKFKSKFIKIASSDITDLSLLKKINSIKGAKIILSTGMSNKKEISKALKCFKNKKIILLHCVSLYPCEIKKINLTRMVSLKKIFNTDVGFSDHTIGINACLLALTMGAKIIEKHFTLSKKQDGPDHILSADEKDLKIICEFSQSINKMKGEGKINPSNEELKVRRFARKGIYLKKNVQKGEKIKFDDLEIKRPLNKFDPSMIKKIIGKKASRKLVAGSSVKKDFFNYN